MPEDAIDRAALVLSEHYISEFVATDTVDALTQRAQALALSGRRMTIIRQELNRDRELRVEHDLTLEPMLTAEQAVETARDKDGTVTGVFAKCAHVTGWGFSVPWRRVHNDALALRRAWNNGEPRKDITLVTIQGRGEGRDDKIEIETYNEHGYGERITVVFTPKPYGQEVANATAAIVDEVADAFERSTSEPTPANLRAVAATIRDRWCSPADAVTHTLASR